MRLEPAQLGIVPALFGQFPDFLLDVRGRALIVLPVIAVAVVIIGLIRKLRVEVIRFIDGVFKLRTALFCLGGIIPAPFKFGEI